MQSTETDSLTSVQATSLLQSAVSRIEDIAGWHHPLGFIHVRLGQRDNYKMRLHIWPNALDLSLVSRAEQIHNHSFGFISHVLNGSVLHVPYEITENSNGPLCICRVETDAAGSRVVSTDNRCNAAKTKEQIYTTGDRYRMAAGDFHAAIGFQDLTATLVLAIPDKRVQSLILCPEGLATSQLTPWRPLEKDKLKELICEILIPVRQRTQDSTAS